MYSLDNSGGDARLYILTYSHTYFFSVTIVIVHSTVYTKQSVGQLQYVFFLHVRVHVILYSTLSLCVQLSLLFGCRFRATTPVS